MFVGSTWRRLLVAFGRHPRTQLNIPPFVLSLCLVYFYAFVFFFMSAVCSKSKTDIEMNVSFPSSGLCFLAQRLLGHTLLYSGVVLLLLPVSGRNQPWLPCAITALVSCSGKRHVGFFFCFLSVWAPVLFVYVLEGVKWATACMYVLLAVSTGSWCSSALALVRSSYPECSTTP